MEDTNKKLDRREFLGAVGLAAVTAGTLFTGACSKNPISSGGMTGAIKIAKGDNADLYPEFKDGIYQIKDFSRLVKNDKLGLSAANIEHHLGLYAKYVNKVNAAEASMQQNQIDEASMKNLAFSLNGMFLHDIYFSNMTTEPSKISKSLKAALENTFGTYENYMVNLVELARKQSGTTGWSITAVNLLNGSIFNYGLTDHSGNYPGYVMPILALDIYEHAYDKSFGTSEEAREKYLKLFPRIIDWDLVSRRFAHAQKLFA